MRAVEGRRTFSMRAEMRSKNTFWMLVGIAIFLCFAVVLCDAQERTNTHWARDYEGRTVGARIATAQAECNVDAGVPCYIVIDADMAAMNEGTLPAKCAQCYWMDYRSGGPASASVNPDTRGYINLVTDCGVSTLKTGAENHAAIDACFVKYGVHTYRFPAGIYAFDDVINFDLGGGILECEGSAALGDWGSAVRLNFPADKVGVSMSGAGGQKFRGCRLVSSSPWQYQTPSTFVVPYGFGGANTAELKADCVQIRGHGIEVADTTCESFGRHGVNIDSGEFGGNQNQWRVKNLRAYGNRGAGLHIKGGDSNIGKSESIDATYNQFGAILDESFLGNVHDSNHADGNHYDGSTVASTCPITNQARTSNVMTYTCASHGFAPMDTIRILGTGVADALWTVFSTPDANNFTIRSQGSDIASAAATGTAGRTAAYDKWRYNATGCAINSASTTLTCAAGFESSMKWDLVSIPGAGAAGAALNTWITSVTSSTQVVIGTAAGTTVASGGTAAVALNGPSYKMSGQAQFGCVLLGSYSEGSGLGFGQSQVADKCLVLGGEHGAGWDSTTGAYNFRQDGSNVFYGGIAVRPANYGAVGAGSALTVFRSLGNSSIIDYDVNSGSAVEAHRFDFTDAALTIKDSRANGPSITLNKTGLIQIQAKAGAATSINFCNGCTGDIQIADGAGSPANTILLKGSLGKGIFNGGVAVESTGNVTVTAGTGVPSAGACTASTLGALYLNKSGGASTTLYLCTAAGVWTAK